MRNSIQSIPMMNAKPEWVISKSPKLNPDKNPEIAYLFFTVLHILLKDKKFGGEPQVKLNSCKTHRGFRSRIPTDGYTGLVAAIGGGADLEYDFYGFVGSCIEDSFAEDIERQSEIREMISDGYYDGNGYSPVWLNLANNIEDANVHLKSHKDADGVIYVENVETGKVYNIKDVVFPSIH